MWRLCSWSFSGAPLSWQLQHGHPFFRLDYIYYGRMHAPSFFCFAHIGWARALSFSSAHRTKNCTHPLRFEHIDGQVLGEACSGTCCFTFVSVLILYRINTRTQSEMNASNVRRNLALAERRHIYEHKTHKIHSKRAGPHAQIPIFFVFDEYVGLCVSGVSVRAVCVCVCMTSFWLFIQRSTN